MTQFFFFLISLFVVIFRMGSSKRLYLNFKLILVYVLTVQYVREFVV